MVAKETARALRAALDVIEDVGGLGLLATNCGPDHPPNSRVVKAHLLDSKLDTVYIATNRYTDKVQELAKNPLASVSFYTNGASAGDYVVLRGKVTRTIDFGTEKEVISKVWRDEDMLPFFQGGPQDDRFCVLEFKPHEVSLISAKHNVAAKDNGWRPAKLERVMEEGAGSSWRLPEDDISSDRLRRLRGAYDADGRPLPE